MATIALGAMKQLGAKSLVALVALGACGTPVGQAPGGLIFQRRPDGRRTLSRGF